MTAIVFISRTIYKNTWLKMKNLEQMLNQMDDRTIDVPGKPEYVFYHIKHHIALGHLCTVVCFQNLNFVKCVARIIDLA